VGDRSEKKKTPAKKGHTWGEEFQERKKKNTTEIFTMGGKNMTKETKLKKKGSNASSLGGELSEGKRKNQKDWGKRKRVSTIGKG